VDRGECVSLARLDTQNGLKEKDAPPGLERKVAPFGQEPLTLLRECVPAGIAESNQAALSVRWPNGADYTHPGELAL
jgi:hypothetical protein